MVPGSAMGSVAQAGFDRSVMNFQMQMQMMMKMMEWLRTPSLGPVPRPVQVPSPAITSQPAPVPSPFMVPAQPQPKPTPPAPVAAPVQDPPPAPTEKKSETKPQPSIFRPQPSAAVDGDGQDRTSPSRRHSPDRHRSDSSRRRPESRIVDEVNTDDRVSKQVYQDFREAVKSTKGVFTTLDNEVKDAGCAPDNQDKIAWGCQDSLTGAVQYALRLAQNVSNSAKIVDKLLGHRTAQESMFRFLKPSVVFPKEAYRLTFDPDSPFQPTFFTWGRFSTIQRHCYI